MSKKTNTPPTQDDHVTSVLRARARTLAQVAEDEIGTAEALEVVEFRLADERHAFESRYIREVFPITQLTTVPCTPAYVLGLTNLRGELIAVMDLRQFFELPCAPLTKEARVIVLVDGEMTVGMLAEAVVGVRMAPLDRLLPSLPTLTGIRAQYLRGVTEERLVILDARALLTDDALIVHDEA